MDSPNIKGAVAEQAIVLAAMRLDVPVWSPVSEHGRVDLVLSVGGRLWRVQCKWGRLSPTGDVIVVHVGGCRRGPSGYVRTTYSADEVDLFAIYCGDLDRCFLIPASLVIGKHAFQLRVTRPRNSQRACINLADDFDFEGAIAQLGERVSGTHEVAGSSPASSTSNRAEPISIGSNPFRAALGYWMQRVAGGEEVIVTFRGKPRIRLSPVV